MNTDQLLHAFWHSDVVHAPSVAVSSHEADSCAGLDESTKSRVVLARA